MDWSSDPTPGDPDRVADLALRYRRTAEAVATASANLGRIADGTAYQGKGGEALRERTRDLSEQVGRLQTRYAAAAEALEGYHPEQHAAQVTADAALSRARQARDLEESAQRSLDRLGNTPTVAGEPEDPTVTAARNAAQRDLEHASSELQRAKNDVQRAHDDQHAAANRAAGLLQEAIDGDGLNDSWKDNALGVVKSLANIASALAAITGILALVLCWVPVVGQVLAAATLLLTAASLLLNVGLQLSGKDRLDQIKSDLLGLALFGFGRVLASGAKLTAMATRGRAFTRARALVSGNSRARRDGAFQLIGGRMRAPQRAHGDRGYLGNLTDGLAEGVRAPRAVVADALSALRHPRTTWTAGWTETRAAFAGGNWQAVGNYVDVGPEIRALTGIRQQVWNGELAAGAVLTGGQSAGAVGANLWAARRDGGEVWGLVAGDNPPPAHVDAPASQLPEGFEVPSSSIPSTPAAP
ncbi:hypothetical protein [Blastococcus sp. TBT05-19]|uniref:hypothetical protein n=1 Tax=Blastococcus sp. TBT05-19 TaxID=2250581 RepID=UPI0013146692|nr:hypothetical protein [Blastococcus sp. TBT05-19]